MQMFDIMMMPANLTPYELNQKLIIVAKKEDDNLDRLALLFEKTYPMLLKKRALLIDDEADYASVGFRKSKVEGLKINTTAKQIDSIRKHLFEPSFLQVTATPYSLYLQPENISFNGNEFLPIRPAFTELVPVHPDYIGSDYYFEQGKQEGSVASFIYETVSSDELSILHHEDRRRIRSEECLTTKAIPQLRAAISNFIVGACIRRLQDREAQVAEKKFSFLIHTEPSKAAHSWQEDLAVEMNAQMTIAVTAQPALLRKLFSASYDNLTQSIKAMDHYLPPQESVLQECFRALVDGWLMITKVNSERAVEELLDDQGQLRLRTPLNVFIGGQILDRGITVANLIGFFYGRRPRVFQQDTVLQHSRMFGFRPKEDLTVTRFYTEPQIYIAMRRMHESDVALRESISRGQGHLASVIFIQRSDDGRVIPCSPNKILISNTTTLRPFKRILPIGFQTDCATRVRPIVTEIEKRLNAHHSPTAPGDPFLIPLSLGLDLLSQIEQTLMMEVEEGYNFDWDAARAALSYLSNSAQSEQNRGMAYCLVRTNRKLSRKVSASSHAEYADAPDTTTTEGQVARATAIDMPMLIMIRQNGSEEQGWRGTPFYWPVIVAQRNIRTAIFAHETTP